MQRLICQKEIARALKVSQSTVSLALRGRPGIGEKTRTQVMEMAKEMGYVPDPMLSSLADYRKALKPSAYRSTVPWLHSDKDLTGHANDSPWGSILRGAQERCEELGFRLEPMWLGAKGINPKNFAKVLYNRGINGLVVAPHQSENEWMSYLAEFPCASVALGTYNIRNLPIDHVSADHYQNAREVARQVEQAGYSNVGVCLGEGLDNMLLRQYSSYFVRLQHERARRSTKWTLKRYQQNFEKGEFMEWVRKGKYDALVFQNHVLYRQLLTQLKAAERKILQTTPLALLCVPEHPIKGLPLFSGVKENLDQVGASAIDLLSSLISTRPAQNRGFTRRLLIEGVWCPGETLPVPHQS